MRITSDMDPIRAALEFKIKSKFDPLHFEVTGDPWSGKYTVLVVSEIFDNVHSPVNRHRMVYGAVGDFDDLQIHALNIDAQSPSEFESFLQKRGDLTSLQVFREKVAAKIADKTQQSTEQEENNDHHEEENINDPASSSPTSQQQHIINGLERRYAREDKLLRSVKNSDRPVGESEAFGDVDVEAMWKKMQNSEEIQRHDAPFAKLFSSSSSSSRIAQRYKDRFIFTGSSVVSFMSFVLATLSLSAPLFLVYLFAWKERRKSRVSSASQEQCVI